MGRRITVNLDRATIRQSEELSDFIAQLLVLADWGDWSLEGGPMEERGDRFVDLEGADEHLNVAVVSLHRAAAAMVEFENGRGPLQGAPCSIIGGVMDVLDGVRVLIEEYRTADR